MAHAVAPMLALITEVHFFRSWPLCESRATPSRPTALNPLGASDGFAPEPNRCDDCRHNQQHSDLPLLFMADSVGEYKAKVNISIYLGSLASSLT
jgi:hypothetical protein